MKNQLFLLSACMCCFLCNTFAQQQNPGPIATMVIAHHGNDADFRKTAPLTKIESAARESELSQTLSNFTLASINPEELKSIITARDQALEVAIPFDDRMIELELVQVNIFADDFTVVTDQSDGHPVEYTPGVYYRGIIKGDMNSLASLSFFEGELMGVILSETDGNIVIGKLINDEEYIIYADRNLQQPAFLDCATYDDPAYAPTLAQYAIEGAGVRTVNCVKLYYETDYDIYVSSGSSSTNTTNWMTAVHNNVATLYSNDQVNTAVSQIFVWTTTDPFTGSSSSARLNSFKSNRPSFNGDLGQLVGIDPGGLGGVASTINGFCSSTNKYCYSDVDYAYNNVPTYSWTIMVLTHEFGHLMGSYHTQNCSWPGGAIDNCYTTEGGCAPGPAPTNGGTIMSYCHLTSYGINFNNGFGTYPGNAIRGAVDASSCLTSSCTGGGGTSYCASAGSNASEEWIQTVAFGSFSNNSGSNGGYANYTAQTITVSPGASQSFTLTPGFNGGPWAEYFSIWIDYNKDFDFADAGENVYNSGGVTSAVSGSFTVQSGVTGTTRMRISMKYNALATSCETYPYGETEDYTVSFSGGGGGVTYCASKGTTSSYEWIDYVAMGSISRTSGSDGGYYNGTALSTSVAKGSSYTLSRSAGMSGGTYTEYWRVWVDWNKDGDFVDGNEQMVSSSSSSTGTLTSTITVPSSASTGTTRMRVSMKYQGYATSCQTFSYGEVEDYTLNIMGFGLELVSTAGEFNIYPNPVFDVATLQFHSAAEETFDLKVYNLLGELISLTKIQATAGMNTSQMNVSDLTNGIYIMELSGNGKLERKKFEVAR